MHAHPTLEVIQAGLRRGWVVVRRPKLDWITRWRGRSDEGGGLLAGHRWPLV